MKKAHLIFLFIVTISLLTRGQSGPVFLDTSRTTRERVDDLISLLTL